MESMKRDAIGRVSNEQASIDVTILIRLCVLDAIERKYRFRYKKKKPKTKPFVLPNVSNDVTPSVIRAGMASGLIQNEIHDITTINADGMYVWNK